MTVHEAVVTGVIQDDYLERMDAAKNRAQKRRKQMYSTYAGLETKESKESVIYTDDSYAESMIRKALREKQEEDSDLELEFDI